MEMGARKSLPVEEDTSSEPHPMKEMLDDNHLTVSRRDREFTHFLDLSQEYHNEFITLLRDYVQTYGYSWQELKDSAAERRKCAERFTDAYGAQYWGSEESRKKYLSTEALTNPEELCVYPGCEEEITRALEILLERKAKQYCKSAEKQATRVTETTKEPRTLKSTFVQAFEPKEPKDKTSSSDAAVRKSKSGEDGKGRKAKSKPQKDIRAGRSTEEGSEHPSRERVRAKTPAPRARTPAPRERTPAPHDTHPLKSVKRKAEKSMGEESSSDESSVEVPPRRERAQTVARRDILPFHLIASPEDGEAPIKRPVKKPKRASLKPGLSGTDDPAPSSEVADRPIKVESKYWELTTFLVSASNQQMAPVWVPFQPFISVSDFLEHMAGECSVPEISSLQTHYSDKITGWQSSTSLPVVVAASVTFPWSGFTIRVRQGKDQDLKIVMEELEKSWESREENQDALHQSFKISVMLHFVG